jgi:hypothetical protein
MPSYYQIKVDTKFIHHGNTSLPGTTTLGNTLKYTLYYRKRTWDSMRVDVARRQVKAHNGDVRKKGAVRPSAVEGSKGAGGGAEEHVKDCGRVMGRENRGLWRRMMVRGRQ